MLIVFKTIISLVAERGYVLCGFRVNVFSGSDVLTSRKKYKVNNEFSHYCLAVSFKSVSFLQSSG